MMPLIFTKDEAFATSSSVFLSFLKTEEDVAKAKRMSKSLSFSTFFSVTTT